ncbi:hypothetical protein AB0395_12200 [Streptosporangium sp. NPDC051023]|uniref:hypothetical protein n=1 Tax=Streptosporangium sp. NPDC051023 TaxID=3155410 RepID=UPI00344B2AD2
MRLALDLTDIESESLAIAPVPTDMSLEALGGGHGMSELAASGCGVPSCCVSCCCCCCV